jgi:hypothetical protein
MSNDDATVDSEAREIWSLPVLSQEFRDGPVVELDRCAVRLRYDYETESGDYAWQEIVFEGVEAFRFTGHASCTVDMIDAYDVLVEVVDSAWVSRLQEARREPAPPLRHLRIYFDELGCYEVVATGFDAPEPPDS